VRKIRIQFTVPLEDSELEEECSNDEEEIIKAAKKTLHTILIFN